MKFIVKNNLYFNMKYMPEWARYIAMDKNGDWSAFSEWPTRRITFWGIGGVSHKIISLYEESDNRANNWKDSLIIIDGYNIVEAEGL